MLFFNVSDFQTWLLLFFINTSRGSLLSRIKNPYIYKPITSILVLPQNYDYEGRHSFRRTQTVVYWPKKHDDDTLNMIEYPDNPDGKYVWRATVQDTHRSWNELRLKTEADLRNVPVDYAWPTIPPIYFRSRSTTDLLTQPTRSLPARRRTWRTYFPARPKSKFIVTHHMLHFLTQTMATNNVYYTRKTAFKVPHDLVNTNRKVSTGKKSQKIKSSKLKTERTWSSASNLYTKRTNKIVNRQKTKRKIIKQKGGTKMGFSKQVVWWTRWSSPQGADVDYTENSTPRHVDNNTYLTITEHTFEETTPPTSRIDETSESPTRSTFTKGGTETIYVPIDTSEAISIGDGISMETGKGEISTLDITDEELNPTVAEINKETVSAVYSGIDETTIYTYVESTPDEKVDTKINTDLLYTDSSKTDIDSIPEESFNTETQTDIFNTNYTDNEKTAIDAYIDSTIEEPIDTKIQTDVDTLYTDTSETISDTYIDVMPDESTDTVYTGTGETASDTFRKDTTEINVEATHHTKLHKADKKTTDKIKKSTEKTDIGKPTNKITETTKKFVTTDSIIVPSTTKAIVVMTKTSASTATKKDRDRCFTCGLNETSLGSSLCHYVFESGDQRIKARVRKFATKCNSADYIGGCFKRFLDVGHYNERGCRTMPPTKGKSFISTRLKKLELLLRGVEDGCVSSSHASLTPYSRPISLYSRYHVCVCNGRYCNLASPNVIFGKIYLYCVFKVLIYWMNIK